MSNNGNSQENIWRFAPDDQRPSPTRTVPSNFVESDWDTEPAQPSNADDWGFGDVQVNPPTNSPPSAADDWALHDAPQTAIQDTPPSNALQAQTSVSQDVAAAARSGGTILDGSFFVDASSLEAAGQTYPLHELLAATNTADNAPTANGSAPAANDTNDTNAANAANAADAADVSTTRPSSHVHPPYHGGSQRWERHSDLVCTADRDRGMMNFPVLEAHVKELKERGTGSPLGLRPDMRQWRVESRGEDTEASTDSLAESAKSHRTIRQLENQLKISKGMEEACQATKRRLGDENAKLRRERDLAREEGERLRNELTALQLRLDLGHEAYAHLKESTHPSDKSAAPEDHSMEAWNRLIAENQSLRQQLGVTKEVIARWEDRKSAPRRQLDSAGEGPATAIAHSKHSTDETTAPRGRRPSARGALARPQSLRPRSPRQGRDAGTENQASQEAETVPERPESISTTCVRVLRETAHDHQWIADQQRDLVEQLDALSAVKEARSNRMKLAEMCVKLQLDRAEDFIHKKEYPSAQVHAEKAMKFYTDNGLDFTNTAALYSDCWHIRGRVAFGLEEIEIARRAFVEARDFGIDPDREKKWLRMCDGKRSPPSRAVAAMLD